jgi:nucleotide-binding universal stress UspA family protein
MSSPRWLLAVDFRDRGATVARAVSECVRVFGDSGLVCHVVMRPTSVAANDSDGAPADPQEESILRGIRAALGSQGPEPVRHLPIRILHGDPGQRICEYADYVGCETIVLGPREKESLGKRLRGSVTRYVLGNTRRSVFIVGDRSPEARSFEPGTADPSGVRS